MPHALESVFRTTTAPDAWEPFTVDGVTSGEVHWLRRSGEGEPTYFAGLWRHEPEGPGPYVVAGSETILVLKGAADLELADGSTVELRVGDFVSFADGFSATWRTLEPFEKLFVLTD